MKSTETEQKRPAFSVFGAKPSNALLVPEMPISVRCNCQSGRWFVGDNDCGSKLSLTILKFSRFFGKLGLTDREQFGQIWFVAESGDLPQGTVLVTYIKTRSLQNFNQCVATIQARGIEPATGIFVPEFVKFSGNKPDAEGVMRATNYYGLKWSWEERKDWSIIDQAAAVLSDPSNQSRMVDLEGTRQMVCLDDLSPQQQASLLHGVIDQSLLPPEDMLALASAEVV